MTGRVLAAQMGVSPPLILDTRFNSQAASSTVVIETRPWDGASDSGNSGTFTLETLGASITSLVISGPQQVPPGSLTPYVARAQFNNGTIADVTRQCRWSSSRLPDGVTFSGGVLKTSGRTPGGVFQISAFYEATGGGRTSAPFPITISPGTWCRLNFLRADPVPGSAPPAWDVLASVYSAPDLVPPLTFDWQISTLAVGANASAITLDDFTGVAPGTHLLSVTVTDADGRVAGDGKLMPFNKPAVPVEPITTKNTRDLVAASFKNRYGQPFTFDLDRVPNGFVIIAHGLNDSSEGWAQTIAEEIEERMGGAESAPNILLFDWREAADVNAVDGVEAFEQAKSDLLANNPPSALVNAGVGTIDALAEVLSIRSIGFSQGQKLGLALIPQFTAPQPLISTSAPVHFIGHSAGGFVVGEAAKQIKNQAVNHPSKFPAGYEVEMVTMLDTPDPYRTHFDPPVAGMMERWISSALGAYAPEMEGVYRQAAIVSLAFEDFDVHPSASYRREHIPDSPLHPLEGHSWAHEWYVNTIRENYADGFNLSPVLDNDPPPAPAVKAALTASFNENQAAPPMTSQTISTSGFTPFGGASILSDGFDLTELANAGVFQNIAIPVGACVLHFEFRFTSGGDGDFLIVQFADRLPMFIGSDTAASRANWVSVDIPIRELQARTGELMFALISRGSANAAISIRNPSLSIHPDSDFDGLANDQETVAGTNPLVYDSDGDGFGDFVEIQNYFTNPMLADSDGDGASDSAELTAGTNPTNGQSYLRVTDAVKNTNGTMLLRWPSQARRYYNVQRSTDVTFGSFEVISQGQAATPPLNTHVDNSAGASPEGRYFYRIEVYQP